MKHLIIRIRYAISERNLVRLLIGQREREGKSTHDHATWVVDQYFSGCSDEAKNRQYENAVQKCIDQERLARMSKFTIIRIAIWQHIVKKLKIKR
jgi:hypothetical protein